MRVFLGADVKMPNFDIVFLHVPRIFRTPTSIFQRLFSKLRVFTGVGYVGYPIIAMGLFGLASSISRAGFKTRIFNLSLEQQIDPSFSLFRFLKSIRSKAYCISLQWCVHSAGTIQFASVCKRLYPDSLLILGGMTASWFSREIMTNHSEIDLIVRGEADENFPDALQRCLSEKTLNDVSGITYRNLSGIKETPLAKPPSEIDSIDYTNLELLENWEMYLRAGATGFQKRNPPTFWLPIARGCIYNCIHCGGGREAYKMWSGREKIVFRSPSKIVEDIERLREKGVRTICLSHDPEILGKKFISRFIHEIKKKELDVSIYYESFYLPSRSFLEEFSRKFEHVGIGLSPESGLEETRKRIGKGFSNNELLRSVEYMSRKGFEIICFFSFGMPGEGYEGLNAFKSLADKLLEKGAKVVPPFPYTIDPNCLMAVRSNCYGVKLKFKSFEDYRRACASENPLEWIGHETNELTRADILYITNSARNYILNYQ
jgi:radical SAM superfamily enzyme YgiQ (UPF0313 family)